MIDSPRHILYSFIYLFSVYLSISLLIHMCIFPFIHIFFLPRVVLSSYVKYSLSVFPPSAVKMSHPEPLITRNRWASRPYISYVPHVIHYKCRGVVTHLYLPASALARASFLSSVRPAPSTASAARRPWLIVPAVASPPAFENPLTIAIR